MSNSSRIEAATRQHVGAVLTGTQIIELVKMSDPNWKGGVYPSDAAYKRNEDGTLVPRGKTAYGDGILEYLSENSFKVLADKDIVRRPSSKKAAAPAPVAPPASKAKKEAAKATPPKPPSAAKQTKRDKAAVQ